LSTLPNAPYFAHERVDQINSIMRSQASKRTTHESSVGYEVRSSGNSSCPARARDALADCAGETTPQDGLTHQERVDQINSIMRSQASKRTTHESSVGYEAPGAGFRERELVLSCAGEGCISRLCG
jgi:uncharacterized protein YajQ (UPF0234 family)